MSILSPSRETSRVTIDVPARPGGRRTGFVLWCAVGAAFSSLARHKTRTFLSTLGIIVGVGCVITMMALGEGTRVQMLEQIRRTGSSLLSVRPGEARQGAVRLGADTRESLTLEDAEAILKHCPAIRLASPQVDSDARVEFRNQNMQVQVEGIHAGYLPIHNFKLARGRTFTSSESASRARLCILGAAAAEQLFGTQNPIGERIRIQRQLFRVIGVLKPREPDADDHVWVPLQTAMDRLFYQDHIEQIDVQALDEAHLNAAALQIEALLRRRHQLRGDEENDFRIRNQQDRLEAATETAGILTALLVGIASISLLVGGIGVMNIMLVSVTERTREIGIRRAVGARGGDILWQFLIEALVMCGVGAALGLLAGFVACWVGAIYAAWPVVVTPASIALSCGFAVAIGLFFGLYPAMRASQLSPLTALRYE